MDRGAKLREFVYLVTVEGGYEKYKENGAVYKTLYNSKKKPMPFNKHSQWAEF